MKRYKRGCIYLFLILFLLPGTVLLNACGQHKKAEDTTVIVDKKGTVTEVIVEKEEQASYDMEELQSFVKEDIGTFNQDAGTEHVKLDFCERRDGVIRIGIVYDSGSDYASYHKTVCFVGTVSEALGAGYDFEEEFLDNNQQAAAPATILAGDSQWKVMILEEPVRVELPGDILYATKNAQITGKREVKIASEEGNAENVTTDSLVYLIYK